MYARKEHIYTPVGLIGQPLDQRNKYIYIYRLLQTTCVNSMVRTNMPKNVRIGPTGPPIGKWGILYVTQSDYYRGVLHVYADLVYKLYFAIK